MDFVTVSTGLILPYWMGLPIRYIQLMLVYKPELDSLYDNVLLFGNKRTVSMDVEEYLNDSF